MRNRQENEKEFHKIPGYKKVTWNRAQQKKIWKNNTESSNIAFKLATAGVCHSFIHGRISFWLRVGYQKSEIIEAIWH